MSLLLGSPLSLSVSFRSLKRASWAPTRSSETRQKLSSGLPAIPYSRSPVDEYLVEDCIAIRLGLGKTHRQQFLRPTEQLRLVRSPSCSSERKLSDSSPQFLDTFPRPTTHPQHHRHPRRGEMQRLQDLTFDVFRTRKISFVDNDHVRDLEHTCLLPLNLVAGFRLQEQDDNVRQMMDRGVSLPGADGLKEYEIEPKRFE